MEAVRFGRLGSRLEPEPARDSEPHVVARQADDEDIASESVKQAIKKLIDSEDTRRPHSDQKLVELLAQQKIVIARRTVAKYREMAGILSSSKRKKYF